MNPPLIAAMALTGLAVVMAILLGTLAARVHPGLVLAAACWLAACAVPPGFYLALLLISPPSRPPPPFDP